MNVDADLEVDHHYDTSIVCCLSWLDSAENAIWCAKIWSSVGTGFVTSWNFIRSTICFVDWCDMQFEAKLITRAIVIELSMRIIQYKAKMQCLYYCNKYKKLRCKGEACTAIESQQHNPISWNNLRFLPFERMILWNKSTLIGPRLASIAHYCIL